MNMEQSNSLNGWFTRYKVNRPLNKYEVSAKLDHTIAINLPPIDKGVLKLNSVFVEYMDRHFFIRGWGALIGGMLSIAPIFGIILFGNGINDPLANGTMPDKNQVMAFWIAIGAFCALFAFVFYLLMMQDFFRYTHYPIRFNRQNRKVYVFRHNGPDGVLELDWDEVYWFVGRSRDARRLVYDLRCHVLDEHGLVRETFAVGNSSEFQAEVLQHWEMIRRYMEEPLVTLPFPPLALVLSTEPTFRNALVIHVVGQEGHTPILLLFTVPWSFFRWISQRTCRRPRWPASVEVVCQIPSNDPFDLPEPKESGTVEHFDEEKEQKLLYYHAQAALAARVYQAEKYGPMC